jgi:hypothetical protein
MTYSNRFEVSLFLAVHGLLVANRYSESQTNTVIWLAWNRVCSWIDLVVNPLTFAGSYLCPPLNNIVELPV